MSQRTHYMMVYAHLFRDSEVLYMLRDLAKDPRYNIDWTCVKKGWFKSVFRVTGKREALSSVYKLTERLNAKYHWHKFCHTGGVEKIGDHVVEYDGRTIGGLRAVILMTKMGHRCGYVGVGKSHPLYGADYSIPHPALAPLPETEPVGKRSPITLFGMAFNRGLQSPSPEMAFDVHGGITYTKGGGDYPALSVRPTWWFGFDASHYNDAPAPGSEFDEIMNDVRLRLGHPLSDPSRVHRTKEYMLDECDRLAEQLCGQKVRAAARWRYPIYGIRVVMRRLRSWWFRKRMHLTYMEWVKARPRLQKFVRGF